MENKIYKVENFSSDDNKMYHYNYLLITEHKVENGYIITDHIVLFAGSGYVKKEVVYNYAWDSSEVFTPVEYSEVPDEFKELLTPIEVAKFRMGASDVY